MSLNIKDPEAHRLAHAIAEATGKTMTRVVMDALRAQFDQLDQRRGRASVAEILAIAERVASKVQQPYVAHGDWLYDEHGLPK